MNANSDRVKILLLLLLAAFPVPLFTSEKLPEDNLTILKTLASNVVEQVLNSVPPDSTIPIIINSPRQNFAGEWIVVNAFVQHLLSQGRSVQIDVQPDSGNHLIIEFQLNQLGVSYASTGPKNVFAREVVLAVDLRVKRGENNQVVFFKNFQEQYADSLSAGEVLLVDNSSYSFTHASIPQQFGIKKLIQPLLILAVTGTVIYSFFFFRSK